MLNTEHAYFEAGYQAARARIQRDEGRASHWTRHFQKMRDTEAEADRAECRRLFEKGYAEAQPRRG